MWTTYYLKFGSHEEYLNVMPEHMLPPSSMTHETDTIGVIYREDTEAATEGFHVNLRLQTGTGLPDALQAFALEIPLMPRRVFAD